MAGQRTFGTTRKLPSGRWQAYFIHDGYRHVAPHTFSTKGEAGAWLAEAETELRKGLRIISHAGRQTLGAYARSWLDGRSDLRATTRSKYEGLLARHIKPKLGHVELRALTPVQVRSFYHKLATEHQTSADDAYRLLRAILRTAVADGIIGRSPCQVRGAGAVHSKERPVASVDEVTRAVDAADERYRAAFLLAFWCQLRRGEVLGLQRRDIELDTGTVHVRRARVVPSTGSLVLVGPPKTEAGIRALTIPANIIPALKHHLDRFVDQQEDAWLFTSTEGGGPLTPRTLDREWDRARNAIGRPDLHFHDLRHSGLTLAASTGASIAELMKRGGHASSQAALKYQHATEEQDKALAEKLAQLA